MGQVRKVDHKGNLVVEVEGQVFRYSPACCLHEPGESVTAQREETVKQEMTSMKIRSTITGNMENFELCLSKYCVYSLFVYFPYSFCLCTLFSLCLCILYSFSVCVQ